MNAFQIWWMGYPFGVWFAWFILGKFEQPEFRVVLSIPRFRAICSAVLGAVWPLLLFELLAGVYGLMDDAITSFWRKVVRGDMSALEWFRNVKFGGWKIT